MAEALCGFCDLTYTSPEGLQSIDAPWEMGFGLRGLSNAAGRATARAAACRLEKALDRIPKGWGKGIANRKGTGGRWFDPKNAKDSGIRIDRGNPKHKYPSQQVDHVVVRHNGRIIGPDGKPISGSLQENPQAHIPVEDWIRWTEWNHP